MLRIAGDSNRRAKGNEPMQRVPVYEPRLTDDDARAAADAVRSGWVSSAGPAITAFEAGWAAYCGMPHGVAVSSGTAALELALATLGLQPGDEVICPTFTIVSCVRAIVLAGATPVLVDAEPDTWNLDLDAVAAKIGPRTRAVLAVHVYGHPYDARRLRELTSSRGVVVIEDAAEAHGAEIEQDGALRRCGSLGDVAVFSFYANKPITTGEGGMVLARDPELAARVRWKANLCFGPREDRFLHRELGANHRLTNVQAAIGLSQLARFDTMLAGKRRVGAGYRARLAGVDGLRLQKHAVWARPIDWMNGVVLEDSRFDARELARRLDARGIETRPFFLGMHEQPAFHARGLFVGERYPVAEMLARRGLYLPSSPELDDATLDRVCDAVRTALTERP